MNIQGWFPLGLAPILSLQSLMDMWAISAFWLLWILLLWTWRYVSFYSFGFIPSSVIVGSYCNPIFNKDSNVSTSSPTSVKWHLFVGLICIMMLNIVSCVDGNLYIFEEMSVPVLCPVFNWIVCFLLLSCCSFKKCVLDACVCAKLLQSCPLFANIWTVAHQALLSMGFYRQEYYRGLPWPATSIHILDIRLLFILRF